MCYASAFTESANTAQEDNNLAATISCGCPTIQVRPCMLERDREQAEGDRGEQNVVAKGAQGGQIRPRKG